MPLTGRRPTLMVSADGMGGSHLPGLLGQVICCSVLSLWLHQAAMTGAVVAGRRRRLGCDSYDLLSVNELQGGRRWLLVRG
jgi:hypothetical protein